MSIIRQRKLRIEKMKKYLIAGGILLAILLLVLLKGLATKGEQERKDTLKNSGNPSMGKETGMEEKSGAKQSNQQNTAVASDMRRRNFEGIFLDPSISLGDTVDIRIRFANGLDFVVLTRKEITGLVPSTAGAGGGQIELLVSEEEQLRMSSAFLDAFTKQDTKIYAAEYLEERQKAARPNYPIDPVIRELLYEDPNVSTAAVEPEESVLRHYIEELPDSSESWEQGTTSSAGTEGVQSATDADTATGQQDTSLSGEREQEEEEFYYVD